MIMQNLLLYNVEFFFVWLLIPYKIRSTGELAVAGSSFIFFGACFVIFRTLLAVPLAAVVWNGFLGDSWKGWSYCRITCYGSDESSFFLFATVLDWLAIYCWLWLWIIWIFWCFSFFFSIFLDDSSSSWWNSSCWCNSSCCCLRFLSVFNVFNTWFFFGSWTTAWIFISIELTSLFLQSFTTL